MLRLPPLPRLMPTTPTLPMPTDMPTTDTLPTPMPTATITARGPLMPRLLPPLMLTTGTDMLPTLMDIPVDTTDTDTPLVMDTFINLLDNCIELRKMQNCEVGYT